MIKITVDTNNGVQIVKEGTIVKGELKDLLFELTALQSTIVDLIVAQNKHNIQPGKSPLDVKLDLVNTMARTTRVALECGRKYTDDITTTVQNIKPLQEKPKEAAEEVTVNDIIRGGLGIDMDKITWEIYATNELVEKWWPIMNDHIMTQEEMKKLHEDAEQAGINMDDYSDYEEPDEFIQNDNNVEESPSEPVENN